MFLYGSDGRSQMCALATMGDHRTMKVDGTPIQVAEAARPLSNGGHCLFPKCYYICGNLDREAAMVELKLRKIGNSLGVVLPREVVNRLHVRDGERLFLVEAPDGSYRLTPYDPGFQKKMAKAEDIMGRYRNTLRALAK
jgi:putative addiction module antidote